MKKLLLILALALSANAWAEPKKLVCTISASDEANRLQLLQKKYEDPNYFMHNPETAKEFKAGAEACRKADFGLKRIFVFDTEGLSNKEKANAEYFWDTCNPNVDTSEILEVTLSSTPSVISFTWLGYGSNLQKFNIDRKTLKAGYNSKRDYQCNLEDIDTSENIL